MTTSSAKSSQGGTAPQEMFDANEPIAIIGMAALFPKAADLGQYWRNIVNKEDCISEVPATHWSIDDYYDPDPKAPDKTYCKRGGFIPDVKFDPAAFGIPPHVVKATDTGQLLGLHVAAAALKDARLEEKKEFDRDMCNVILGVGGGQEQGRTLDNRIRTPVWRRTMIEQGVDPAVADSLCKAIAAQFPQWEENSFPGLLGNVVSGRIANRLNLGGTNLTVDAACASGLAAAHTAVAELRGRLANISLTGAVDADNDVFMFMCFSKTPAFSASNEARPFDAKGDGILIAEGVGMCVLKRLADAERDGDRIYAVIRSIGTSSDGRYKSIYAPNPDGQSKALHRAYTMAGFSPETVELVEAHGTGTKAGDFAEFSGLNRAFRQYKAEGQWCALGSVKSQIGHSKGVAGIAGLIKAVMAVHEKVLPPTIKVTEPNPKMEIEKTPFYLNTEARPWFRPTGSHPRRAGVSAFGFGGTNFHCVLEEYVQPAGQEPALTVPAPTALFVLGGQTGTDVVRLADALEAVLHKDPDAFRREAHRTQKTSVRGEKAILSVVASSVADLSEKLALARRHIAASPEQIFTQAGGVFYGWRVDGNVAPKVAVLFPGQGSQYVNMGMQWALRYPEVRRAFEDADRLMLEAGETPLSQVAFPHPTFTRDSGDTDDKRLTETRWAQPALGALSMGLYDVLKKLGLSADFFGGHSYGELAALWAAGVLGKDDFLALSRARGTLMGQAASALERSGMSSAQGPVATMQHVLPSLSRDVIVANINSPEQCVIAGPVAELQRIQGSLETQGFLVSPLNVSAAFHSPFVAAAKDPFSAALRKASFGHARKPVFSNVTAKPYPANGAGRDVLADQLVKPVNFLGLVQEMYDSGARVFLEVGAKGVLSGLVSRILGDKPHAAVAMDASAGKTHGDTAMQLAVAQLVSRGVHLDLNYLVDRDPTTELKPREPNTATTITIRGPNPKANPPPAPKNPPRIGLVTTTGSATVSAPAPAVAPPPTPTVSAAPRPTPPPPPPPPRAAAPAPTTIIPSIIPAPATERITSVPTPTVQVISPMTNPTNPPNPALLMSTQAALAAFQAHQQQMAMVHHEFLRASQEAMRTFTTLFEAHARQMAGAGVPQLPPPAMTTPPPTLQPITVYPSVYTQAAPVAAPPPPVAPVVTAAPPPPPRVVAPAPVSMPPPAPVVAARPTPPPPPAPRPAAAAAGPAQAELSNALLSVVSEKTGYPQDMLKLDMDMEADLGIDSIKRVEILGAMQAKFPNAPKVETEKLGELHTLQQILEYLARGAAAPVAARPAAPVAAPAAAPGISTSEMTQGLLAVVSEKTGYPVDMLKLEMDMEADLGIDSIKRVEILGAMQAKFPNAPKVETEKLGEMHTLEQIVSYLSRGAPAAAAAPAVAARPAPAPATPTGTASGPGMAEMTQGLLQIVADKTGYPVDMLKLDMDLEADLGIDSIKRVEILGAMQARYPNAPKVETDKLGEMHTLQQILGFLGMGAAVTTTAAPVAAPAARPAESAGPAMAEMTQGLLQIVSEKTGYPVEMLKMDMDLEADLGIDSIKRVEILGAMQAKYPNAPKVETDKLGEMHTLQQILGFLGMGAPAAGMAVATSSPPVVARAAPAAPSAGPAMGEMTQGLLQIVSEKTGYPVDMLKLDMDLEADLGIDSIKRVEILGAMQARYPNAPKVETDKLGEMHTLQQILGFLGMAAPVTTTAAPPPTPPPPAPTPAGAAPASVEFTPVLLQIVSEKTGYPVDMLKLDMDMEADLGIDSIKRVEILGAMQARFPNAPKVETDKLGEMHTLQQIVGYLSAGAGSPAVGNGHGTPSTTTAKATGGDVHPFVVPAKAPEIRRYKVSVAPVSLPPVTQPLNLPTGHVVLITDDGHGYAPALAGELKRAGYTVVLANLPTRSAPYTADARVVTIDWTDEAALKAGLAGMGAPVGAFVHLAALRTTAAVKSLTVAELRAAIQDQLRGPYLFAKHLSPMLQKAGGLFATATSMDGHFGFVHGMVRPFAPQGGLAGLAKTLSVEWPTVACRAFDLDPSMTPAQAALEMVREIRRGNGPTELGLSVGVTRGVGMVAGEPVPTRPLQLDASSVVVITGGARGVTADVALGMARRFHPTMVLLGRSPAPTGKWNWCANVKASELKKTLMERFRSEGRTVTPKELEAASKEVLAEREITETLEDLRKAGSRVEYRSVDVRDAAQVARAIEECRRLGPIHGLVHGAGVIQDKLIEQKTPEMFDSVFETKVMGLRNALDALKADDLRFVVLFSSIAGRSGNKGQADYAMANEVLNKMGQELRTQRPTCHVSSIGWGPWQGGMVTPELEKAFLAQGISAIPKDTGVDVFLREIAAGKQDDVEIVVAGLPFPRTFEWDISADTDRYLADHVISGKPVVPAMMVLEWFAQAGQSTIPGQRFLGIQDFKVLKGVVVEGRMRLRLTLEEAPGSSTRARWLDARLYTVEDASVKLNYRAVVTTTSETTPSLQASRPADLVSGRYSMGIDAAYRDRLFHGPRFRVIESIDGSSDAGMVAKLRTSTPAGWAAHKPEAWVTDPALMDAALQMAVLWIREKTGSSSLPTSVGRYVQYAPFGAGPVSIHLRMQRPATPSGLFELVFTDAAGRVLAVAGGVELTASEALNPMFRQAAGQLGMSA